MLLLFGKGGGLRRAEQHCPFKLGLKKKEKKEQQIWNKKIKHILYWYIMLNLKCYISITFFWEWKRLAPNIVWKKMQAVNRKWSYILNLSWTIIYCTTNHINSLFLLLWKWHVAANHFRIKIGIRINFSKNLPQHMINCHARYVDLLNNNTVVIEINVYHY